jgi:hypothetical protein
MLIALALSGVIAACGGDGEGTVPRVTGPVDPQAADRAVLALCRIAAEHADDREAADALFLDQAHELLHAIAAAAEQADRAVAADLLTAKQRVEADLSADELPTGFAEHVRALVSATGAALEAIGLTAPACPT